MYCPGCNYDLSGLGAGPCPECGRAFDPDDDMTYFRIPREEHRARWLEICIIVLAANPLIADILVHVTLVAARVSLGRWPNRLGNDDPWRDIDGIDWLLQLTRLSLTTIIVSSILSLLFLFGLALGRDRTRTRRALSIGLILWAAGISIFIWDPTQAWTWFFD